MFPEELINVHAQKTSVRTYAFEIERYEYVKKFTEYCQKLGIEDLTVPFNVEFLAYFFTGEVDRARGKTPIQGMIQFEYQKRVADAKDWFRTTFEIEPCIFYPTVRPTALRIYIGERQREVENGRQLTLGMFEWDRNREYVKKAMFKYFLNGGRDELLDHFSLIEILDVPVNRIQEEAQLRRTWLESKEQKKNENEEK